MPLAKVEAEVRLIAGLEPEVCSVHLVRVRARPRVRVRTRIRDLVRVGLGQGVGLQRVHLRIEAALLVK